VCAQNLVSNGGFEDENICTEYQKNCAPEAWIATSLFANYYFDDAQHAYKDRHFVGLTAGNISKEGIRNFVRTRLLCGLRPGNKYRVEFFVRSYGQLLDSIGVYFSPDDFLFEKRYFKDIKPQLWSPDAIEKPQGDPSIWQKIGFIYTATGQEGFITIGNFKRDDYKNIKRAEYRNDYYFFIDEVSVIPVDEHEKLCAEADSVKTNAYDENERHDYLSRKMYVYRRRPPVVIPLPRTVIEQPRKQKIDTLVIPDIFFATASYELSPKSFSLLDSFSAKLENAIIDSVIIEGHTDSIGKLAYNEQLSANRANSVKDYLSGKSFTKDKIMLSRGFAFLKPIADNRTPAGRSRNRRVEIFVYRKE
jgi:outer membrane protein OmpA-like peptidoglycan-associated protein